MSNSPITFATEYELTVLYLMNLNIEPEYIEDYYRGQKAIITRRSGDGRIKGDIIYVFDKDTGKLVEMR